jgi:membrane protein
MFFIFPILIVLTSGLSIFIAAIADRMPDFLMLGSAVRFLIDLTPYVLMSAMFVALYVFMPNTKVELRSVIVPGILAGIAMQGLQFVYIHSQIFLSSYNAIYGSFAALPLFMLWMQISWTICLFGAELCYTNQNLDFYDYDAHSGEIRHRYKLMLCAVLMSRICRRFAEGKKPYSILELRQETSIPIRFVSDLLYELINAGLLTEVTSDEKSEESRFMPAEDISNLTLGTMIDRLEAQGTWKIDLDLSNVFTSEWRKVIEARLNYLKTTRNILLQDL